MRSLAPVTLALLAAFLISSVVLPAAQAEEWSETVVVSDVLEWSASDIDVSKGDSDCGDAKGKGCGNCGCDCGGWILRANALFLERANSDAVSLIINPADLTQQLNASDLSFPLRFGWDVSAIKDIDCERGIELRYFEIGTRATQTAVTTGAATQIVTNPLTTLVGGQTISAVYGSHLRSAEVNGRRLMNDWLTMSAGFRYVELDEGLNAVLFDGAIVTVFDTRTRNRLYGFQLGGEAFLMQRGPWSVEALGKVGIYANRAANNATLAAAGATFTNDNATRAAFLGEFGITGALQLTDSIAIRAGYQLLYFEGVAIATDQLAVTDLLGTLDGIDASGRALFHGGFAGLEIILP